MKVYVITRGEYSDYEICAVAIDKEKADWLAKYYNGDVEEYDTDDAPETIKLYTMYGVTFDKFGDVECVSKRYIKEKEEWKPIGGYNGVLIYVVADDEQSAIKIAAERRAKYLAEKYGL